MLVAQAKATKKTNDGLIWLVLNYAASNPDAAILYTASGMVLHIHSDPSYLSEAKARRRAGGHFFLSNLSASPNKQPTKTLTPNGPIYSLSQIIHNVMASAAKTEVASSYVSGTDAMPIQTTLEEMGHPQPPTSWSMTPLQRASPMKQSSRKDPRQSICDFIGSKTGLARKNS